MTEESRIKRAISIMLKKSGVYFFYPSAGRVGTKDGVPDIIVCKDGLFFAIEIKCIGGTVSNAQKKACTQIESNGGVYILATSREQVEAIIFG